MPANFHIASVHFSSVKLLRPAYQGIYEVEPCLPGAPPKYMVSVVNRNGETRREEGIVSRIQHDEGGYSESNVLGSRRKVRETIYANEIAYCLINEATKLPFGASNTSHPGLWVVRERVLNFDEAHNPIMDAEGRQEWRDATEEEAKSMWDEDIEHNRQADAQYARDVFDYWDSEISRYPKMIKVLPKMVRDAAAAYGWQAEWLRGTATIAMKECPFCGRNVRKQAVICPNTDCQQVIDYDRYAQEMAKRQAALKRYGIENADPTNLLLAGIGADPKQKPGKAA